MLERVEDLELDLGLVATVHLEVVSGDSNLGSEDIDSLGSLSLGDGDVAVVTEKSRISRRNSSPNPSREDEPGDVLEEVELERLDGPLLTLLERALGGNDRVLHQHGDRHGSDSSGDGGDVGSDLRGRLKVDVANETGARLPGGVCNDMSQL